MCTCISLMHVGGMQVVVIPIMLATMDAAVVDGMQDRASEIVKELTALGVPAAPPT